MRDPPPVNEVSRFDAIFRNVHKVRGAILREFRRGLVVHVSEFWEWCEARNGPT